MQFHHLMSSEMPRACETTCVAMEALGFPPVTTYGNIIQDEGLGYVFAEKEVKDRWPWQGVARTIQHEEDAGRKGSLGYVLYEYGWPGGWMLRGGLQRTLHHWALRFAQENRTSEITVLVGSHATASYAALDPEVVPGMLGNGDIMKYVVDVDAHGRSTIVASEYLPAPPM